MRTTTPSTEKLVQTIVLFSQGIVTDTKLAAAVTGISEAEFIAACNDPELVLMAEAELTKLRLSGKNAEVKAMQGLDRVVERLTQRIETDDDISDAALVRTGEFLHRVTGTEQKRGAELKVNPALDEPAAKLIILTNMDDVPPPPGPNEKYRLVIDLRPNRPGMNTAKRNHEEGQHDGT